MGGQACWLVDCPPARCVKATLPICGASDRLIGRTGQNKALDGGHQAMQPPPEVLCFVFFCPVSLSLVVQTCEVALVNRSHDNQWSPPDGHRCYSLPFAQQDYCLRKHTTRTLRKHTTRKR